LQSVPISIAVLDGAHLAGASGAGLLASVSETPSLTIREEAQGSATSIAIRGVSATSALFSGSSPIGFYLDSLPFGLVRSAVVPDANPYDLDRVEVLRGPQGTLYGAGSLNGVVRVLTKEPDLNQVDFKGRVSGSNTEDGGANYRSDGAINFPLIDGKLAARLVAGYQHDSGWIDSPHRTDVNYGDVSNFRLKVKGQPTADLSIGFSAWRSRAHEGAPSISGDQFRKSYDDREPSDTGFDTYNMVIHYSLPGATVSSSTSYLKYTNRSLLSLAPFGPGLPYFDTDLVGKNVSEELLINSTAASAWRWLVGGLYRSAEEHLIEFYADNDATDNSASNAVFGQLTRSLLQDRLQLSAGLRYFEDTVSNQDNPGAINTTPPFYKKSNTFHRLSPETTITLLPAPDSTIYASYGEGFRSGFSQLSNVERILPRFPPAGPDKLANYELGTKNTFLNGRLAVDAAVYYIGWKDTQQIIFVFASNGITRYPAGVNVGKVDGVGVDFALKARPLPGLQIGIGYHWNNLAFRTPAAYNGQILFAKDFRPTGSAEETIGGSVLYSFKMKNGWVGHAEASANYTSALSDISLVNGVPDVQSGQPICLARAALGLETLEHLTVTAFVDNLTNTHHYPSRFLATDDWTTRLRPRTVGLEVAYHLR